MYCFDVLFAIRLSLDARKSALAAKAILRLNRQCVTNSTDWTINVVLQVPGVGRHVPGNVFWRLYYYYYYYY
jgi:hypothetical protein